MQMNKSIKFCNSLYRKNKSDLKPDLEKLGLIRKLNRTFYHKKS